MSRLGASLKAIVVGTIFSFLFIQMTAIPGFGKTTITVMDWRVNSTQKAQDYFHTIKARFEEQFPDVEVEYIDVSMNEIMDKLIAGVVTGTAPDVVMLSILWARDLYEEGLLTDLTNLIEKTPTHTPDQFIPVTQLYNQVNGRIYGVPVIMDTGVLYYNVDHFEETGLDIDPFAIGSWDEFVDVTKKLTRTGVDGVTTRYGYSYSRPAAPEPFNSWLASNGGQFYVDEGLTQAGFNTEAGLETAQFIHDLINVHGVVGGNFTNQTSSMAYANNATPRIYIQNAPDMRFQATSIPQGPSGSSRGTTVWSNMMAIPSSAKDVDLAFEYIKTFSSLQGSIDMLQVLDYVGSPRFDFYQSAEWQYGQSEHPWMGMIPQIAILGQVYPFRKSSDLAPIWQSNIEKAVASGSQSIRSALDETERLYNQVLSQ